ncbi:S-layer homology domain-containing protein [Sporosarcina sp.]|uniref:S-layer homology domain-containing protein n=1 Tax=Sporosarcina sp. TaxID=49982 RepID=UPI002612391C|nr:S-layer homology domain-containing protein [Sporosarcina sp.]
MRKVLYCLLSAVIIYIVISPIASEVQASSPKIAVLFSKTSEDYANAVHPGGTYKGQQVSPKVDYSSTLDKELKAFHMYKQQGFDVTKIYEKDLNNLQTLSKYDAIVFAHTVMTNHQQRENIKLYIRSGGGAIFAFQMARNEAAHYPQPNKMDLSPLIYHVESWVMEWDNLTEVFQSRFIDDVVLRRPTISNMSSTHPIIRNTTKELGKSTINITKSYDDWVEIIKPWKSGNAVPILHFTNFSLTDKPTLMNSQKFGAAHAINYGKGRIVQTGFKIMDHIQVSADANWEDHTKGLSFDGTGGDKDASVFMKHSLNWVSEKHHDDMKRQYNVSLSSSNVSSYLAPSKQFVFYSTVTVKNNGNVPARGTLKLEILNSNGNVIGKGHERYLPGLAADTTTDNADRKDISTHAEKYQVFLPGNLPAGTYTIRTAFVEGRADRKNSDEKFTTASEVKTLIRSNGANRATIGSVPFFFDVTKSGGGYFDIQNLHAIGIVKGYQGIFNPTGTLTRIQATEMILRSLDIIPSASATIQASDIKKGDYGYAVLATGARHGIISLQNGRINAHLPINRADMARALVNGFKLQGFSKNEFKDISASHPYYKDIQALYMMGITTGYEDQTFRPNGSVSRKNFSQFLNRALQANSK